MFICNYQKLHLRKNACAPIIGGGPVIGPDCAFQVIAHALYARLSLFTHAYCAWGKLWTLKKVPIATVLCSVVSFEAKTVQP